MVGPEGETLLEQLDGDRTEERSGRLAAPRQGSRREHSVQDEQDEEEGKRAGDDIHPMDHDSSVIPERATTPVGRPDRHGNGGQEDQTQHDHDQHENDRGA